MNYTALLHTHRLVVTIFLAIYILKLVYLLAFPDSIEKISKRVKVPEMIVSFLFFLTGIGLLVNVAEPFRSLYVIKLIAVLASIPLAVLGFKKKNKTMGIVSVALILAAYGLAEAGKKQILKPETEIAYQPVEGGSYDQVAHGQALYNQYCPACHGENGDKGLSGAKNLKVSVLSAQEIVGLLEKGKNAMPSYNGVFSEKETQALISYLNTLRK